MTLPTKALSTQFNYKVKWRDLFPTNISILVFGVYVSLFVNHGLLTRATQKAGKYDYNYTFLVLGTELAKFLICLIILLVKYKPTEALHMVIKEKKLFVLYLIPAGLYVLYNNLAFVSLQNFEPATYLLLMNIRTVVLGFVYQVFLNTKLSKIQWTSLIILTFACILKEITFPDSAKKMAEFLENNETSSSLPVEDSKSVFDVSIISILILFVQILSSCTANVYNQILLKNKDNADLWIQNLFMYLNGFLLNLLVLVLKSFTENSSMTPSSITHNFSAPHLLLILNQTFLGISASMLLKYLNVIIKAFSSAVEMLVSAIAQYLVFGLTVKGLNNYLAYLIAWFSLYLYALNPIENDDIKARRGSRGTPDYEKVGNDDTSKV